MVLRKFHGAIGMLDAGFRKDSFDGNVSAGIWPILIGPPPIELRVHPPVLVGEATLVKDAIFVLDPLEGEVKDCYEGV